jgi:hypothetical protein
MKHIRSSTSHVRSCRRLKLIRNPVSYQSTVTTIPVINESKKQEVHPPYPLLDMKFNEYQIAYRYRQNMELLRGYFVYQLFSFNFVVNNQDKVIFEKTIHCQILRVDYGLGSSDSW